MNLFYPLSSYKRELVFSKLTCVLYGQSYLKIAMACLGKTVLHVMLTDNV